MAEEDRVAPTALHEAARMLLPLGAMVVAALFVVAGAANLGFYDAFGIQDVRLVGVDKSAIVDHAVLFGAFWLAAMGTLFAMTLPLAAGSTRAGPAKARGRLGMVLQAVGLLAGLAVCVGWTIRNLIAAPLVSLLVLVTFGTAVAVCMRGRWLRAAALARPWRLIAIAVVLTVVLAVAAFGQGSTWGRSVADLDRRSVPVLGFTLIVQWPQGALLGDSAPSTAPLCTEEILLGRSGGTYVLYNARARRTHELPAQPLTRVGLVAVNSKGCPPG